MNQRVFEDQIRYLIDTSGQTRYRIAVETGIAHATLSRFMNGKAGLSMPNLNALADYLEWSLVARKKRKG